MEYARFVTHQQLDMYGARTEVLLEQKDEYDKAREIMEGVVQPPISTARSGHRQPNSGTQKPRLGGQRPWATWTTTSRISSSAGFEHFP